ncbi:hypothetical protein JOC34_003415 [Virgibacillus halotolerans]|nr:hypothetical protein [Virgibacillus halotolerans]
MDKLKFRETFTLNGEEINQYLGYPHTVLNYIEAVTRQLVAFLNSKDVTE